MVRGDPEFPVLQEPDGVASRPPRAAAVCGTSRHASASSPRLTSRLSSQRPRCFSLQRPADGRAGQWRVLHLHLHLRPGARHLPNDRELRDPAGHRVAAQPGAGQRRDAVPRAHAHEVFRITPLIETAAGFSAEDLKRAEARWREHGSPKGLTSD